MIGGAPLEQPTCSRVQCRAEARWRLEWHNPAIHTDGRTKVWLACDEHREFLSDFLSIREFPLIVTELSERTLA